MKKQIFLSIALAIFTLTTQAQKRHGQHHQPPAPTASSCPPPAIRYAMTEDGQRIVLFPDGTWKVAKPVPVRRNYTSEIFGTYLYIYEKGKEIARVKTDYETFYDPKTLARMGSVSFANATYQFDANDGTVRFQGLDIVGHASKFDEARNIAAYHYTTEVFNGLTSEIFGSYLYIYENSKEIDRLKMDYSTWTHKDLVRMGNVSFANATYSFDGHDGSVRFLGNEVVGYAHSTSDAKTLAAFHYVSQHYGRY